MPIFDKSEWDAVLKLCPNANMIMALDKNSGLLDDYSTDAPHGERLDALLSQLKKYLIDMNAEREEYECPEEDMRLESEARGILMAIRELLRHFPDLDCRDDA